MTRRIDSLPQGVFTISIDFELIWGTLDKPQWTRFQKLCLREREHVIDPLLALFAEFGVSASWCTVGHLFLDGCRAGHGEIARTPGAAGQQLRFGRDPGSNEREAPIFYGRTLVDKIRRCPVPQEIGSHSFSHSIFTECSEETAADELAACVEAAGRMGLEMRSFVYPRNRVAHTHLLPRYGFDVYRGPDDRWHERAARRDWRHRLGHVWDIVTVSQPPVVLPVSHEGGLWEIPGSMLYTPSHGVRGAIPMWMRVSRARKGLRAAVRDRRIFHLWFHPTDLAARCGAMLRGMRQILEAAARLRDLGALTILPMGALAAWLEGEVPTLESAANKGRAV